MVRKDSRPPGRLRGRWLRGAALAAALGSVVAAANIPATGARAAQRERRLVLFYTAEIHGAVEPCGCTSDPLGDVSRLAAAMAEARRGRVPVALVDAGGSLYPEGAISARERPSADLRASFLAGELAKAGLAGAALGQTDLAAGPEHVQPARLASNLASTASFVRPARVANVGDIKLGVLGVADPEVAAAAHVKPGEMIASARRDVERLRREGAEIVVLLAPVDKAVARRLAREVGADIVVLGKRVGQGQELAEKVGRAFLVAPAEELQRVGRLEIVLRSPAPGPSPSALGDGRVIELQDAGGSEARTARRLEVNRTIERRRAELAQWNSPTPSSGGGTQGAGEPDRTFIAAKQRELEELLAEQQSLKAPWAPPATGDYLINTLLPLRRSLPRDSAVVARMKQLDQRIAAVNLKQAQPPPPPEPGRSHYVGMKTCAGCHAAATTFWKTTVHAHAWRTLVDGKKQADYKCVGCHVTGFGQVGGSTLGFTAQLESVQCETCHGPGSAHVAGEGNEQPIAVKRDPPETLCLGCHTEQHSDTFQFDAYLRDVVGPGHGKARRETLGDGPTGHGLRQAALAKAKQAGAATLKKM